MNTKKKILYTSHTANFSKFNRCLMVMMKQKGYIVHYASAGEELVSDCDKHIDIPFRRNPLKLDNLRAYFKLKNLINQENYNIIHTHTPVGSVITRFAARTARKNGTKVIYTAHGFHFFKNAPIINWLTYYPIEKLMASFTDVLITINREDYEIANRKFDTDVRKIDGIGIKDNYGNIKLEVSDISNINDELGLDSNSYKIIYPAEINKNKNQLWLISALAPILKERSNVHILLPGQDSLKGKAQNLAKKLGINNQIHFLGYRNDIARLMKISDLAISASKREGLPVNILEAMFMSLPIIASNCRGNRDLVRNYDKGWLYDIGDDKKLREILTKEMSRPQSPSKSDLSKYYSSSILKNIDEIYHEEQSC